MATSSTEKLDPFIEKKVRTWYRLHNKKRNGFMSRADFAEMADTFISEYHMDDETAKGIRSWLVDGWSALIKFANLPGMGNIISREQTPTVFEIAEKLSTTDGKITEDMYVNAYSEITHLKPNPFPVCFYQMITLFFNIFDANKDGFIQEEEMIRGLHCFGIDNREAVKKLFADLDIHKQGKICRDTYISAWMEFMIGTDRNAPMARHFTVDIL